MRQGTIYLIENKVNGNKYIGQTVMQLNKRWLAHIQESKTFSERPLYRAMNKYGLDSFNIKVIEETTEDNLSEREVYWIEYFNSYNRGYNATTGGEHPEHSEKTKDKISQTMSDLSRSDEWKDNISIGLKNKFERGERWGFFLNKNVGGTHAKRKVQATNITTGETIEFESTRKAAFEIAGNERYSGNICRAIKDSGTAYGYKWERLDNRPIVRPVIGYDKKTGELVYEFESINKAGLTIRNKRGTGITKSLKNPGKYSWMGCYWYYKT